MKATTSGTQISRFLLTCWVYIYAFHAVAARCPGAETFSPHYDPTIPDGIADAMENLQCRIPNGSQNFAQGEFKISGQTDYAAICITPDDQLKILLFEQADPNRIEFVPPMYVGDWRDPYRAVMEDGCTYYPTLSTHPIKWIQQHVREVGPVDMRAEDIMTDGLDLNLQEGSRGTLLWNPEQGWHHRDFGC